MITVYGIGALCIGVLLTVIGVKVLLRRGPVAAVCLVGRTTTGRVVRIDRGETAHARLRLAFRTADGREVEYLEPIAVRAKVGDQLRVRYRAAKPEVATCCRLRHLLGELLAFGIVFVLGGLATVTGALISLVRHSEDVFWDLTGAGLMAAVAATFSFISLQSYATARRRVLRP